MNTSKKIISLLMCMLMVLTMVPMSVFAVEATEIDTVHIEGVPAPLYGQTIKSYYESVEAKITDGTITVNDEVYDSTARKYGNLLDDGWNVRSEADGYLSSTSTDLIKEGTYYVAMWFLPDNGFVIPEDVNVIFDGAKSVKIEVESDGCLDIRAEFEVKAPAPTEIDTVHIEGIPAPLYGQTVGEYNDVMRAGSMNGTHKINGSTRVNIAEDIFYGNIELSDWEYYNSEKSYIAPSSADNLPSVYYLVHWLYPVAGYKFPDDVAVTVDGAVSVETELDEDGCLAVWAKFEVAIPAPAPESDFQTDTYEDGVSVVYKGSNSVVVVPSEIGGKKVLEIEYKAFPDCVECVVIPETVKSIKTVWAFDSKNIKSIEVDEDNAYYSSVNGVLFNKDKTVLLKYPRGNATKNYTVNDTVKTIGKNAFWKATNLEKIIIPEGVTTIEKEAFTDCTALKSIDLPKSITFIDYRAFMSCKNLESVVLPEICTIRFSSFYECDKLKEITIPASVKRIDVDAFNYCPKLETVNYIGDKEMWDQTALSEGNTPLLNATFKFCAHENTTTGYIAPTCAEEGYTEGKRCNNCKKILSKSGAIPAIPHTYDSGDDAECNVCGTVRFIRIEGLPAPEYGQTVEQWYNIYDENWENGTFNINGVEGNDDWFFGSIEYDGMYQLDKNKEIISDYSMIISEGVYYWCIDVAPVNDIKFPDDLKIIVDGVNEKDIELDSYGNGWFSIKIKYKLCIHTYDNACDINCNKCGETRTVPAHTGGTATCTAKAKCSACGEAYGSLKAHTYKNVTTKATLTKNGKVESKCSVCGYVSKTTTVYYPKTIKLSKTAYTYNGKVQTPSVTVKDTAGNTLKKDTDYTVKYESGRKAAGKYTVTITFKGKYEGTKKLTYTIAPKKVTKLSASQTTTTITLKWSKVTGADAYRVYKYNSKTKKYEKLKDVTKTTLKISKLKAGTAYKYKVRAITKDDGSIYSAYSDVFATATKCKTPSISKLTSSKKGIASLTWTNVSGESGYQVYYSTKKDSGYKKAASYKVNVVKGSKKKLKSGKKYYFKVRAYKKTASGTVYSSWSAVKSVKIK